MPNWNIAGTVTSELLPVTTPTALVMKNNKISKIKSVFDIVRGQLFLLTNQPVGTARISADGNYCPDNFRRRRNPDKRPEVAAVKPDGTVNQITGVEQRK
jgi:hypothetical protein